MRRVLLCIALALTIVVAAADASSSSFAQRRGSAKVCGDPTVKCQTIEGFQPFDLPFRLRQSAVIWESEAFYAVILKSVRVTDEWAECETFIPESDRLEAQTLFPHNKVFTSRCIEPGGLYYTNTDPKQRFIAVYAGLTRAEANATLAKVKATGKYAGANLRRMRAGFNGT